MNKILISFIYLVSTLQIFAETVILDRIAIIVDDGVVMESQIKSSIVKINQRYEDQNIPKPPLDVVEENVKEQLIIEELQLQLADRAGVRISDAELNVTVERLARNNQMSLEEFISFIENSGDSYEDLRDDIRKEMRIQRIQRGRVNSTIDITEKEFDAFLATDDSLDALQPELLVRQILVKDKSTADNVIDQINKNIEFSDLAKQYSLSATAQNGGLMSWKRLNEMPVLYENALDKKSVGYISEPLESGSGFHILKLEDKKGDFVQFQDQWKKQVETFNTTITDLIPDYSETTAKSIRDFAIEEGIKPEVIDVIVDPGIVKFVNDYRQLKMGVSKGSAKRKAAPDITGLTPYFKPKPAGFINPYFAPTVAILASGPPIKAKLPPIKAPSAPNLNLFLNRVSAKSLPDKPSSLSGFKSIGSCVLDLAPEVIKSVAANAVDM